MASIMLPHIFQSYMHYKRALQLTSNKVDKYEGTTSNSQNNNGDQNAPMTVCQNTPRCYK